VGRVIGLDRSRYDQLPLLGLTHEGRFDVCRAMSQAEDFGPETRIAPTGVEAICWVEAEFFCRHIQR
jgi:hypothetical protein